MPQTLTDIEDIEIEDKEKEEESSHVQYDIASYPSDLTLTGVWDMWKTDAIFIPNFQRKFVWTIGQASLLIDSFLCGLPVPPVFFYIDEDNKNLVIDGQQRIMSIVYFLEGFFGPEDTQKRRQVFRLKLPQKNPYSNMSFADLSSSDQRKLLHSSVLRAINIRQINPEDKGSSAFHIFERLNTGGTPLTPQEIRNCVFRGEFAELLTHLNTDLNWRKIIGKPYPDKHQKDIELILRIFSLTGSGAEYEKPMRDFLNSNMREHRDGNTLKVHNFKDIFPKITKYVIDNLGEKPFHLRGPLNTSAMDSVMSTIIDCFSSMPSNFSDRYHSLKNTDEFREYTTLGTTDATIIKKRFSLVRNELLN
nr:DUF262 domain-containing protein [uncultured Pseudodesulfovibrio sp.]